MNRKFWLGMMLLWTGVVMVAAGWALSGRSAVAAEPAGVDWASSVIRLHVVANSDSDEDQALKRAVRDAILAEVTPLFEQAASLDEAKAAIAGAVPRMEEIAAGVVARWGKSYPVKAETGRFSFPGKRYGMLFLPVGEYDALRIAIGAAEGANWWCILFPPVCFVDWSTGVVLEPKPGTNGMETVAVRRQEVAAILDEEALEKMPVKARFALLEWLKKKGK